MAKTTLKDDLSCLKRAIGIWRKYAPRYWTSAVVQRVFQRVSAYFSLTMSALLLDEVSGAKDRDRLLLFACLTVFGGFAFAVLTRLLQYRTSVLDSQSFYRYRQLMLDESCKLAYEHLENPDVNLLFEKIDTTTRSIYGGLMAVLYNVPQLVEALTELGLSLSLTAAALFAGASGRFTGILRFINTPWSAVLMFAIIVAFSVLSFKLSVKKRGLENEAMHEASLVSRRYNAYGNLWGVDMTVFGMHEIVLDEYRKYTLRPSWLVKRQKIGIVFRLLDAPKNAVMQILIHLYVAAKAFCGAFGVGSFVLYEGAISRFANAVNSLASILTEMRFNTGYLQTTYELFDLPNRMYQGTLAVEKRDDLDYEIEFRDVSFKYPRTDVWALRHVSMKFQIGDKIAIVGENGSGKTTFIKLLCRLYDPTEGKILLNGIDITRYRYDEYLALFSVVFQDFRLFQFSLGDNVSAGFGYDEARARDCLARAGMGEKLCDLDRKAEEDGGNALDYCIGRGYDIRGVDFSGGEVQKIALARALYKDAPFVILDEPTASLDPLAEAAVYENFNEIAKDRTTVFISHRLSSCRFCGRILVFDRGRITQDGRHEELYAGEGKYRQLWDAQAKYYRSEQSEEK